MACLNVVGAMAIKDYFGYGLSYQRPQCHQVMFDIRKLTVLQVTVL
jgi:hypothetical protein